MFYKSTYQENLSTSEAIKEVTLEEVTYGAGRGGAFSLPEPMAQLILGTCQSRITGTNACPTIPGNLTSHNKC